MVSTHRTGAITIRPFRSSDAHGLLELYETVFGERVGEEWLEWKYVNSPYVDHVPIVVAAVDDEIVGARPFLPMPMSVGGSRRLALQPADAMVHPDFRRRGVLTRMTERAIERYEGSDAAFFFNFPNARVAAASRKLGWRRIQERPTYYRFGAAAGEAAGGTAGRWLRTAEAVIPPLLDGYSSLRRALASPPDGLTIRRESTVPAEELAALYRTNVPDAIHAVRDETFIEWRFASPSWTYETYVVDEDPSAAVVVGTQVRSGTRIVKLTDVVPLGGERLSAVLPALLDRVLDVHESAPLIAAPSLSSIEPALARFGFLRDSAIPLRYATTPTNHFVRTLTGEWTIGGVDVTDGRNWAITFAEVDTS